MKVTHILSTLVLVAATGAHAQGMSMPTKPAASTAKSALPLVDGEVKKIDMAKGLLASGLEKLAMA